MQYMLRGFPLFAPRTAPHLALPDWVSSSETVAKPAGLAVCADAARARPSNESAWRPASRLARGSPLTSRGDSASLSATGTALGCMLCCSHREVNVTAPREEMLLLGVPRGSACSSPDGVYFSTQPTGTCPCAAVRRKGYGPQRGGP